MVRESRVTLIPEMKIRAGICIMQVPALYYCYKLISAQSAIRKQLCYDVSNIL